MVARAKAVTLRSSNRSSSTPGCVFVCLFVPPARRFHVCVYVGGWGGDFMSKGFFFHFETVCLFYDANLCCYLY